MQGYCLSSQDIRARIKKGVIIVPGGIKHVESKIQPASYEPSISGEIWEISTERGRSLAPSRSKTIQSLLDELADEQKEKHSLEDGYELKKGYTYLIRLEEKLILREGDVVLSSPKSSIGRLFPRLRLLGDYNPCFDELHSAYCEGKEISLWLLIEPQAFDLVLYPGLVLTQLRFHVGSSKLDDGEILKLHAKTPLLSTRTFEGELAPISKPVIYDGLQLHLDLVGSHSNGIVGLKAKKVASPIDLSKEDAHDVRRYFEVLTSQDAIIVRPGEYYLFLSKEVLFTPENYNFELKDHSHIGLLGPLHFAGFVDNGFKGDLVFEVRSDELHDIRLQDGMPLSRLSVFRTRVKPDKVYGKDSGSHYQEQVGARPSKYFRKL